MFVYCACMSERLPIFIGSGLGVGIAFGVTLGAAVGVVTGDLRLWLVLGPMIGGGLGMCLGAGMCVVTRRSLPGVCPHCEYSTEGLTRRTCPECGKDVAEPAKADTE